MLAGARDAGLGAQAWLIEMRGYVRFLLAELSCFVGRRLARWIEVTVLKIF